MSLAERDDVDTPRLDGDDPVVVLVLEGLDGGSVTVMSWRLARHRFVGMSWRTPMYSTAQSRASSMVTAGMSVAPRMARSAVTNVSCSVAACATSNRSNGSP